MSLRSTVVRVIHGLDRRRVLLITTSTCRAWRNFLSPRVWGKVPEESTLIFADNRMSLQHSLGQVKESCHVNTSSVRLVVQAVTDRQTDTRSTTIYTALAWRGVARK